MKIFRAYIITAIVCISLTVSTACIFIADENAKKISLGSESAVVVINSDNNKLKENEINPVPFIEKIKETAKKAASIAPPPISNIYWFSVNIENSTS